MSNYFNVLQQDDDDFVEIGRDEVNIVDESSIEQQKLNIEKEKDVEVDNHQSSDHTTTTTKKTSTTTNTSASTTITTKDHVFDIQFDFHAEYTEEISTKECKQPWVLFFDKKNKGGNNTNNASPSTTTATPANSGGENDQYLQNIKKIGTFNNLNMLKELWNGLSSPPVDSNISIFKEGIEPAWEDQKNKDGGKYSVNYMKDNAEFTKVLNNWFTLSTTIVHDWEHYNQINGIVLSFRSWGVSINVWNDNADNQDAVQSLKDSIQNMLKVKYAKYSSHNNTILFKTLKKSDEKKKKTNKLFGKIDHNLNFQSYIQTNNLVEDGWSIVGSSSSSTTHQSGFSRGFGAPQDKQSWSIPNPLRKIKPIQSSSQQDDMRARRDQQIAREMQIAKEQQLQQQQQKETEPAIPVPDIPTGVNAWSTGILFGKGAPEKPTASTTTTTTPSDQTVPEVAPSKIVVEEKPAWGSKNVDWHREIEEGEIVEDEPVVVAKPSVVVEEKPAAPEQPKVNAWSTGLFLTQTKPEVDNSVKVTRHEAPQPTQKAAPQELEEGEIVEDEPVVAAPVAPVETEKKKNEKKEKKEKKVSTADKKKDEKKEDDKKKKKNDKVEPFWEDNNNKKSNNKKEKEEKKEEKKEEPIDPELPPLPIKKPDPAAERKKAYRNRFMPQQVSLWEKNDVLKMMETVEHQQQLKLEETQVAVSDAVPTSSSVTTQVLAVEERITISIKPKTEEKKIPLEARKPAADEWIEAEKPKKKKQVDVDDESKEGGDNQEDKEKEKKKKVEKKVEKVVAVPIQNKNTNKNILHALEVEAPLVVTPKKKSSTQSTTSTTTTTTTTTTSTATPNNSTTSTQSNNNSQVKKTNTSTTTTNITTKSAPKSTNPSTTSPNTSATIKKTNTSSSTTTTTTVTKSAPKSSTKSKANNKSSSSSSSVINTIFTPSLIMNLGIVFVVLLIGFILKYLLSN